MEGVGQIFGSIVENESSPLTVFLNSLDEHQTFWNDAQNDPDVMFTKITTMLPSAQTRDRGLKVLIHLLPDCPLHLVEEKAQFFLNVCTKLFDQRGPVQSIPLAYKFLQQLISRSLSSNELHKLLVSNMTKLVESVGPGLAPLAVPSALGFLELAMQHYPGACGPSKTRIEAFLYSMVDATEQTVVKATANCLLLLQQIRGGGQNRNLHKLTWEEYYGRLVDTIHDLLSQIFAHTPETFDEEENLECLKLPPIGTTSCAVQTAQLISVRARNLIAFLDQAIVGVYPVERPIVPFKALNLVLRGLSVSCEGMAKNPIAENIAFGTFLPSIHYGLLEVLDGMVLALGTNIMMFGDTICEMYSKCLKATVADGSDAAGAKKSFTRLRKKIYESIRLWCESMRYGSGIEIVNEAILEHVMRDITPYANEITLTMGGSNKKRLSAKAKRKLQKEQNSATALNQAHSGGSGVAESKEQLLDQGNEGLCQAALECLAGMLQSAGCFMKPITHKLLQEKIVPLCFSLVTSSELTGLYGDGTVRIALLRAFAALIVNPHRHCPPPLQYASYILNTLQTSDPNAGVRSTAAELARSMELLVHPWKETLYFPADQTAIKDALANKDKQPLSRFVTTSCMQDINGTHNMTNGVDAAEDTAVEYISTSKCDGAGSENEAEINESLLITETSEDSTIVPEVVEDEPVGWVEHISSSPVDSATKVSEARFALDNTSAYNEGELSNTADDEKPVEPVVVSVLDSDEEQSLQDKLNGKDDNDEVVEVPIILDAPKSTDTLERNGKHSVASQGNDEGHSSSPKKAKLAENFSNGGNNAKNIDDIVNEMVAEFVDEP